MNKHTPTPLIEKLGKNSLVRLTEEEKKLLLLTVANSHEKILVALKISQEELKHTLKESGDCDHSVGICVCALIALIEDNQETIIRAEAV